VVRKEPSIGKLAGARQAALARSRDPPLRNLSEVNRVDRNKRHSTSVIGYSTSYYLLFEETLYR